MQRKKQSLKKRILEFHLVRSWFGFIWFSLLELWLLISSASWDWTRKRTSHRGHPPYCWTAPNLILRKISHQKWVMLYDSHHKFKEFFAADFVWNWTFHSVNKPPVLHHTIFNGPQFIIRTFPSGRLNAVTKLRKI